MYAPNEYYKPYNPSNSRTRERYRERQRVPPQYVGKGGKHDKPLATFRMLDTDVPPSPPASHSLNTTYRGAIILIIHHHFRFWIK